MCIMHYTWASFAALCHDGIFQGQANTINRKQLGVQITGTWNNITFCNDNLSLFQQ